MYNGAGWRGRSIRISADPWMSGEPYKREFAVIDRRGSGADCKSAVHRTRVVRLHLAAPNLGRMAEWLKAASWKGVGRGNPTAREFKSLSYLQFGSLAQLVSSKALLMPRFGVRVPDGPPEGRGSKLVLSAKAYSKPRWRPP